MAQTRTAFTLIPAYTYCTLIACKLRTFVYFVYTPVLRRTPVFMPIINLTTRRI